MAEPDAAAKLCTRVLDRQPENAKALYRRAKARAALGDARAALADARRAKSMSGTAGCLRRHRILVVAYPL